MLLIINHINITYMMIFFQVVSMDKLSPTAYSDDYWEKRYTLRRDRVPSFLLPLTDQILRTGKYLNVIKQCGKNSCYKSVFIFQLK